MIEMFCAKCGKNFIPAPEHLYRNGKGWYCSYTCWIRSEDEKKKQGKPPKMVEQCTPDGKVVRLHYSIRAVAEYLKLENTHSVIRAIKNKTVYKGYLWRYVDGGKK